MVTALIGFMTVCIPAVTLEVQETQFLLDGKPAFLLGVSYYGALGASDDLVDHDLQKLSELGFNWTRVWATWAAFDNNVSAVGSDGSPREPYLSKLKRLCEKADKLDMVVDVTLSRGGRIAGKQLLPDQKAHLNAVTTITKALEQFGNVYIDLGNERNIKDPRHVTFEELKELRKRVKELDPDRLITASHAGDIPAKEMESYLSRVRVDFITPHRPRNAESPHQTADKSREYFIQMEKHGKKIPIHYQEPFRRDFGRWQPKAQDFLDDLKGAIKGEAAGWCFHNGDNRDKDDGRPRRSFDMRESEGGLFDQLDEEEIQFINQAFSVFSR
jgi:hypothetical protein